MAESSTIILGIPVPSTDPIFLGLVGVHIAFGLCAVASGVVAMFSPKGRGRHANFGTIYFWALAGVFATMSLLSVARWAADYPLFVLGALSFGAALFGRRSIRRARPRWHLAGMGASYILMLTAFYVDNGSSLPVWNRLPHIAFWFVPAVVGPPLLAWYLLRLAKFRL